MRFMEGLTPFFLISFFLLSESLAQAISRKRPFSQPNTPIKAIANCYHKKP
jgi:hypothetical protein